MYVRDFALPECFNLLGIYIDCRPCQTRQWVCHGINGPPTNGSAWSKYFRNIVPPGPEIFGPSLNKVSSHGVQLGRLGLGIEARARAIGLGLG